MMGADMVGAAYNIVRNSIVEENPEISQGDLIAKIFRRYYRREFFPQELEKVMHEIKAAHLRQTNLNNND